MRHPRERLVLPRGYSRREFLRLSGGLAGGVLLSACGGGAASQGGATPSGRGGATGDTGGLAIGSPGNPAEQPLFDDRPPIESGLDPESGPLRLYNWADYINKPTLDKFAETTGVEYELTGGGKTVKAGGEIETAGTTFDGLRTGEKLVLSGPQGKVTVIANAEPGP